MTPKEALERVQGREVLERAQEHARQTREAVRDALAALDRAIKMHEVASKQLLETELAWAVRAERDSKRRARR